MRRLRRPGTIALGDIRTPPDVDVELEWSFNRAECELGLCSNFTAQLGARAPHEAPRTPDALVGAAHALRRIQGWLRKLSDLDWGILHAAYEVRAWPVRLYDYLGRLTGVVVRLACGYSGVPCPADARSKRAFISATAEALVEDCGRSGTFLVDLRRLAEKYFVSARHAYLRVRGTGPCVVVRSW